jgi:D-3-phosphoglycerate dehydrogenase
MSDWKILIVDEIHPAFFKKIIFDYDYYPNITWDEMNNIIEGYDILVLRSRFTIDKTIFRKAKKLKIVGRLGSGVDNIDVDYLKQNKIELLTAPEGNSNAVAEQAIGAMLSLINNVRKSHLEMQNNIWDRKGNRGIELESMTVGVIGYGNIGNRLVELLAGFGCDILVYDKYKQVNSTSKFQSVSLKELLNKSDIISIHIPYSIENHHFVDTAFFDQCKDGCFFINFSRGAVVDTEALIAGIKIKKVQGAALDVFENEKPETFSQKEREMMTFLVQHTNILCTPHIAGITHQSFEKTSLIIAEKIHKYTSNLI